MNHLLLITAQDCGQLDGKAVSGLINKARTNQCSMLDALLEANLVEEHHFLYKLSNNSLMSWWEPQDWNWNPALAGLISRESAYGHGMVPLLRRPATKGSRRDKLVIATYRPNRFQAELVAEHESGLEIEFQLTTRSMVHWGLRELYGDRQAMAA